MTIPTPVRTLEYPSMHQPTQAVSVNPASGEQIATYAFETDDQLEAALTRAAAGFAQWKRKSADERSDAVVRLAQALRADVDALA
ncbi:MAG: aldehyde dehydrogenase family protein, partial [Comamonadaceae bacterium]